MINGGSSEVPIAQDPMFRCFLCKENKPRESFTKDVSSSRGISGRCRQCNKHRSAAWYVKNRDSIAAKSREYYAANRGKARARGKKYRTNNREKILAYGVAYKIKNEKKLREKVWQREYGLSGADVAKMVIEQSNSCAICFESFTEVRMCIDHDHATGLVRGLLCLKCNRGIGLLGDNVKTMDMAISYLGGML